MKQAIATAFFEIEQNTEGEIQLTPAGYFRAIDGRPKEPELNQGWLIDEKIAKNIINKIAQRKNPLVVDYNHASLIEGHEAPAAGWMPANEFYWNDKGLKAKVEWTERAKTSIANKEHKYISPVFIYDTKTGEIKEIINAALTNTPALDGMAEAALSQFFENQQHKKGKEMASDILYTLAMKSDTLFNLCGLASDATEEHVIEAVQSLLKKIRAAEEAAMAAKQGFSAAIKALGATEDNVVEKITELKNKVKQSQIPTELLFQHQGQIESLKRTNIELQAALSQKEIDSIIQQAQQTGKLPIDEDDVALKYAKTFEVKRDLLGYLETLPTNRPPNHSQTGGRSPFEDDNENSMKLPAGYTSDPDSMVLHTKVNNYMAQHPGLSYLEAARKMRGE